MPNHASLKQMVCVLIDNGLSERELGRLIEASQSTVHRMRTDPEYKTSDLFGQRVRLLYRRLRNTASA